MDVNPTTPLPSSSSKRPADFPPASSSADKSAKILQILLPDGQLTKLNYKMNSLAYRRDWEILVDTADDSLWLGILSDVLMELTRELASTDVITNITFDRADDIVKSFNKDQLEEWKVDVRNAVRSGCWNDLLERRT